MVNLSPLARIPSRYKILKCSHLNKLSVISLTLLHELAIMVFMGSITIHGSQLAARIQAPWLHGLDTSTHTWQLVPLHRVLLSKQFKISKTSISKCIFQLWKVGTIAKRLSMSQVQGSKKFWTQAKLKISKDNSKEESIWKMMSSCSSGLMLLWWKYNMVKGLQCVML